MLLFALYACSQGKVNIAAYVLLFSEIVGLCTTCMMVSNIFVWYYCLILFASCVCILLLHCLMSRIVVYFIKGLSIKIIADIVCSAFFSKDFLVGRCLVIAIVLF